MKNKCPAIVALFIELINFFPLSCSLDDFTKQDMDKKCLKLFNRDGREFALAQWFNDDIAIFEGVGSIPIVVYFLNFVTNKIIRYKTGVTFLNAV